MSAREGNRRRLLAILVPVLCLLGASCVHDRSSIYHSEAKVVPKGRDFAVVRGSNVVLEINSFEGRIFADTAKSYSLYVEIDRARLMPGAMLEVPSQGVACHLWILEAPDEHPTEGCKGTIEIAAMDKARVKARVEMRADDPGFPWTLSETVIFIREPDGR